MTLQMNCRISRTNFNLDVDLKINAGEVLAITGENGSGKTTTLDMIAGLLACSDGAISLHDETWDDSQRNLFVQPEFRGVATVFQGGGLWNHMTVEKNILFGRGQKLKDSPRFQQITEQFKLGELLRRKPPTLSGGQRQRVALARAFLAPSRVLLLDEPTTSLDTDSRDEVRQAMKLFFKTYDGVSILVSHDQQEIDALVTSTVKVNLTHGEKPTAKLSR